MEAQATSSYAGFGKRFVAMIVDTMILSAGGMAVGFVLGLMVGAGGGSPEAAGMMGFVAGGVLGWLYFAMMESSEKGATFGKQMMGIRVTDAGGRQLSFARATGRYFAKFLSSAIFCIGYIMAAFTQKKQALHDMLAGSLVVSR